MDKNSLSHTTWNCKYHIVFAPKYRRQIIYGKIKAEIGKILRTLCDRKGVEIIEAEACPDHIHMLVSIPPKYSVSEFMGYLKGKSSLMIFDKFANMKYRYGNRQFWCRGYYVDTVGRNKKAIEEYIRNQPRRREVVKIHVGRPRGEHQKGETSGPGPLGARLPRGGRSGASLVPGPPHSWGAAMRYRG